MDEREAKLIDDRERRVLQVNPDSIRIEKRTIKRSDDTEVEVDAIVGRAIVFGEQSQLLGGWFKEIIHARSMDKADVSDVVCLKNHDDNLLLGRTPGSLTLEIRADGTYFVALPPPTVSAKDALEEVRAGLLTGCSFQFDVVPGTSLWETDPETGAEIRTVMAIRKLYDVGPVTFPAYLQTSVDAAKRDFDTTKAERERLEAEKRGAQNQQDQQEAPVAVAPLSVYERKLQLLNTTVTK